MQTERRATPYPWTWELPALICLLVLLAAAGAAHGGRALAAAASGNGLRTPPVENFLTALPALTSGDAAAGLPVPLTHPVPAALLTGCLILAELTALGLLTWAGLAARTRWGDRAVKGMATRAQAEALLGRARLNAQAPLIRPDLYRDSGSGSGNEGRR